MAREIKFRRAYFTNLSQTKFSHFSTWGVNIGDSIFLAPESNNFTKSWVDSQFTGLYDKHGKEIFEGDVLVKMGSDFDVELDYDADPDAEYPIIEIDRDVATMERFPVFWLNNEAFGYEGEDLENPDEWEIIGNVFEHPHLLTAGD